VTARPSLGQRFLAADTVPRLAVIAVGVPCLYAITLRGGVFFLILIDLIILLGLAEFFKLMAAKGYRPSRLLGYAGALAVSLHAFRGGPALMLLVTAILILIMIREVFRPLIAHALSNIAVTVFGVMYVGWLGSHFVMLREMPGASGLDPVLGAKLVFFAAIVIWVCDTFAFVFGILIGRRRLAPAISPSKTWSGAIGGLLGGALAGWIASKTFLPIITPLAGALLGFTSALLGQFGDLVESLFKRDAGLKDSARLLPGHGGVLDRMDSLLFSVPFLYYWFRFIVF
jgi:phosphatidate cytidylyltransferase